MAASAVLSCILLFVGGFSILANAEENVVLSREFDDAGHRLVVVDNVLASSVIDRLTDLVLHRKTGSVWQYTGETDQSDSLQVNRYADAKWPWISRVNASLLERSSTGEAVKSLAKRFTAQSDYHVADATGYLLRRGDTVYRTVADNSDESALVVHIELSGKPWRKNDYGETLFYGINDHEKSGKREIEEAVHLKRGRIMMWHAGIPFALRPPSMNYVQSRCGVLILLSRNADQVEQSKKKYEVSKSTHL